MVFTDRRARDFASSLLHGEGGICEMENAGLYNPRSMNPSGLAESNREESRSGKYPRAGGGTERVFYLFSHQNHGNWLNLSDVTGGFNTRGCKGPVESDHQRQTYELRAGLENKTRKERTSSDRLGSVVCTQRRDSCSE